MIILLPLLPLLLLILILMLFVTPALLIRVLMAAIARRIAAAMLGCELRRHVSGAAGEIDIDASGVVLGGVLESEILADSLDGRFDFLDVVWGVVSFADDAGWGWGG